MLFLLLCARASWRTCFACGSPPLNPSCDPPAALLLIPAIAYVCRGCDATAGVDNESSGDEDDGEAEAELSEGSGEESEMTDDEGLEDTPADADTAAGAGAGSPGHARFAPTAEVVTVESDSPTSSPPAPKSPGSPEWRRSRRMSFSKSIPAMMQARRTMSNVDTEALQAAFLIEANEDGVLDKAAFSRVVDALFPGDTMEEQDKVFLKFTLDNVFTTFDRDRDGFVDYDEFCTGMSMLAGDSREQKMRLAFSLMDEDGDGCVVAAACCGGGGGRRRKTVPLAFVHARLG